MKKIVKTTATQNVEKIERINKTLSKKKGLLEGPQFPLHILNNLEELRSRPVTDTQIREVLVSVKNNPEIRYSLEALRSLENNKFLGHPIWLYYGEFYHVELPDSLDIYLNPKQNQWFKGLTNEEKKIVYEVRNIFYKEFINHHSGS